MYKPPKKPVMLNPRIVRLIAIILFIMFFIRVSIIAPKFFPYLLGCCMGAIILFYIIRSLSRFVFPSCPKCGDIMDVFIRWSVFTGAVNKDGGKSFSPIVVEKSFCPKCKNVHMRLRYQNSVRGDARDFFVSKISREFGAEYRCSSIKIDSNFSDEYGNKALSDHQYQKMIKDLKSMVVENNRKAGFPDNEKDIKLK